MEVVPYFLSIIAIAIALYWSAREYRRKPGTPTSGLFRYHEILEASVSRTKTRASRDFPRRPGLAPISKPRGR